MSFPRWRTIAVSPHIPGRRRPQLRHTSSLTPTSLPQEGQRTEPERWRRSMEGYFIRAQLKPDGPAPWDQDRDGPARPPGPPRDRGSAVAPAGPRRDRRPAPRASERRPARGDRGRGGGRRGQRRCGLGDSARWSPPREGGEQGSGRGQEAQFSMLSAGTRENSRTLFVTRVPPTAKAQEAIRRSIVPMSRP